MQTIVEQREQIVGDDALERIVVGEAQAHPKAIKLRAAKEGFAFGLEVVRKLPHEIDRADFRERNLLMLAVGREDVDRIRLAESGGTEIAAKGFLVQEDDDDLLVRRGWGSVLQRVRT